MRRNGLYVLNVEEPMSVYGTSNRVIEEVITKNDCICKVDIKDNQVLGYQEIETGARYGLVDELGCARVEHGSIVSLSEYYNIFGFPKKNDYPNKEIVHSKVKSLKRKGLL